MVDITKTRDELVDRALQKLLKVGAGQSPAAEDQERVDSMVDAVLFDLSGRNIVLVHDEDAIPVEHFEWVADILADMAAPDYGLQRNPQMVAIAEGRLRELTMVGPSYEVVETDHF